LGSQTKTPRSSVEKAQALSRALFSLARALWRRILTAPMELFNISAMPVYAGVVVNHTTGALIPK
jgi:hypothetical protein